MVGGPLTAQDEIRTGRSGAAARAAGLGAAALVGVLAWALFRQPAGELPSASGDDEAAADQASDAASETASEAEQPTTTRARRPSTTVPRTSTTDLELITRPDGTTGPLLGEETGLTLVVGSVGPAGVDIVDLDTGLRRSVAGFSGAPIGMLGTSLVVTDRDGRPGLLDLSEPSPELVRLVPPGAWGEVTSIEEDRIWIHREQEDGPALLAYDEAGEEVERADAFIAGFGNFFFGPFSGPYQGAPGLVQHPGGGLYRLEDGGYRRVAQGRVVALGERLAVVEQCDADLVCQTRWYDTETAAVVGFPAPPPPSDRGFVQLIGGDRWLIHFDWRDGSGELIDVGSGRPVRTLDDEAIVGPFGVRTTISEDGRWLIDRIDGRLTVVDLDDDSEHPIDLRPSSLADVALLIPTPT